MWIKRRNLNIKGHRKGKKYPYAGQWKGFSYLESDSPRQSSTEPASAEFKQSFEETLRV